MTWLINNIGTAVVLILLIAAVLLIIRRLKKDKASGKSTCGGSCAGCALHCKCHGGK